MSFAGERTSKFHRDFEVRSAAHNLKVGFRWQSVLNSALFAEMAAWSLPPYKESPDLLIIGMNCLRTFAA